MQHRCETQPRIPKKLLMPTSTWSVRNLRVPKHSGFDFSPWLLGHTESRVCEPHPQPGRTSQHALWVLTSSLAAGNSFLLKIYLGPQFLTLKKYSCLIELVVALGSALESATCIECLFRDSVPTICLCLRLALCPWSHWFGHQWEDKRWYSFSSHLES